MIFLRYPDLLRIAERATGGPVAVRDAGLLESALARVLTTVGGADAYPGLEAKAAALLHSLARNHALVDGNKRLALAATLVFLGVHGRRLTLTNDDAYDLVIAVSTGDVEDVPTIADRIRRASTTWPA